MLKFEQELDEIRTPAPGDESDAPVEDLTTETTEPATAQESPSFAATHMLELASATAEQVVADAHVEAAAILEASRNAAAEIAARLADQKAELESQIATLRTQQYDHRSTMRRHLKEQLELLDREAPVADAG